MEKRRTRAAEMIDKAIYVVAAAGIVFTVPQVTAIWVNRTAGGVSLLAWSAYLATALFWLAYGLIHRIRPIIFANVLWAVLDALIVIGVVIYR